MIIGPLIKARWVERINRFVLRVELESGEITHTHTTNTGSMKSVSQPGITTYLTQAANPKRKYKYTLRIVEINGALIGVDTSFPNALIREGFESGTLNALKHFTTMKPEVKVADNVRLDFAFYNPEQTAFMEVKGVSLREEDGKCYFPDSKSDRGLKHLKTLMMLANKGYEAYNAYIIQRTDCHHFLPASHIDPHYAETYKEASRRGVKMLIYQNHISIKDNFANLKLVEFPNTPPLFSP